MTDIETKSNQLDTARQWIADGASWSQYVSYAAREVRYDALREIQAWIDARLPQPAEGVYWRGTRRRDEASDLAAGIEIRSRNYADGELEAGLSVCETPAYIVTAGYQYGYRVTGRVVGTGSDGEPLLVDARPVGKTMTAAAVGRVDAPRMRRRRAVMQELADLLAVDYDTISQAYYEI